MNYMYPSDTAIHTDWAILFLFFGMIGTLLIIAKGQKAFVSKQEEKFMRPSAYFCREFLTSHEWKTPSIVRREMADSLGRSIREWDVSQGLENLFMEGLAVRRERHRIRLFIINRSLPQWEYRGIDWDATDVLPPTPVNAKPEPVLV